MSSEKWISQWRVRFAKDNLVIAHCARLEKTVKGEDLQSVFDWITEEVFLTVEDTSLDKRRINFQIVDEWRIRIDKGVSQVWTEEEADREERLEELRQWAGMTDEEVIERASENTLEPDPYFAEWLVLLDRGDLLEVENE